MRRLLPALLSLAACTGAPDDTAAVVVDPCADTPVVTWANFGEGFFIEQCMGCHASTAPDRYGSPEDVRFDTVDDVWLHKDAVLTQAASDSPAMPPGGGAPEIDRVKLTWWLTCAEEGT